MSERHRAVAATRSEWADAARRGRARDAIGVVELVDARAERCVAGVECVDGEARASRTVGAAQARAVARVGALLCERGFRRARMVRAHLLVERSRLAARLHAPGPDALRRRLDPDRGSSRHDLPLPEAQWIVDIGGGLAALGVSLSGVAIGGSARVRVRLLSQLFADATYRESHAFVDTQVGQGATDVESFVSVRLVYRP